MFKFLHQPPTNQLEVARDEGVDALWEKGIHGDGITVALLDSGVRKEILGDRLAWEVNLTTDKNESDLLGHGTTMCTFILGYADRAQIGSIKVVDKDGLVTRDVLISALELCADRYPKIRVVNISLGIRRRLWRWCSCTFDKPCKLCLKVNQVVDLGLIVVAAAGNLGPGLDTITCPGMAVGAYTIGALEYIPKPKWWKLLRQTIPSLYYRLGSGHSGTSVSAAMTSGGIALLLSAIPDLKINEIRKAFRITATQLNAPSHEVGAGQGHYYRTYKLLLHKRSNKPFDPERATQYFERGQVLRDKGNNKESLREFEKAVELAPTSFVFYNDLGLAYLQENAPEKALVALQESIKLHWQAAISHNNLGVVLEKLNRKDEALAHYRIAMQLDSGLEQAAYNIGRLTRIIHTGVS